MLEKNICKASNLGYARTPSLSLQGLAMPFRLYLN